MLSRMIAMRKRFLHFFDFKNSFLQSFIYFVLLSSLLMFATGMVVVFIVSSLYRFIVR